MYPTVNSLMGLWQFVTTQEVQVVERCQAEIQAFVSRVSADDLFTRFYDSRDHPHRGSTTTNSHARENVPELIQEQFSEGLVRNCG
jgi:hypothetical protein